MTRVVGIDLGTTNSLVAYMAEGTPTVIVPPGGRTLVPSVIAFAPDGTVRVGDEAKRLLLDYPDRTVYSIKRFMGKGLDDVAAERRFLPFRLSDEYTEVVRILVGDRVYTPPELSAFVLKDLKRRAEEFFGEPVDKAVITVPAYFDDAQRQATKDAGKIAGLDVLRLVNEPTAASLAYGLDKKREGLIAVYDLGGGTFDISILKLRQGIFEVLATNGDTHLGGDDIDRRLATFLTDEMLASAGRDDAARTPRLLQEMRLVAEAAKCALSDVEETTVEVPLSGGRGAFRRPLTRADVEALVRDIVERTVAPCRQALADAGITRSDIDEVVLVGGATRMPMVRRLVADLFDRAPHTEVNPEEVVALGAAIQADILAGGITDMLLLDVTPLSLGIETMGGVVSHLIERNSTVPTAAHEMFTTFVDNQTAVDIHVLQGEREMVKDCRSLARFQLKGIEPVPAGMPRIEVTFTIDANGILNVTARDVRSGRAQSVEVKPTYGLTDAEVERMIEEAIEHGEEDIAERLFIDARNEAETVLRAVEKSLAHGADLVTPEERALIEEAVAGLRAVLDSHDHHLVRDRLDALDAATRDLAHKLMDSAVKQALVSKRLADL